MSARRFDVDGDPRTYLRVVVGAREGLEGARLRALRAVEAPLDLPLGGQAVIPCRETATCFEIVGGAGLLPDEATAIELIVPALDHRHAAPFSRERLPPYAVDAEPIDENAKLRVFVERDPIGQRLVGEPRENGRAPFARRYELAVAPGSCGAVPEAPWRPVGSLPEDVEVAFDGARLACVALRPARPEGGPVVATRTVGAGAVVRSFRHVYVPPRVPSPLVWLTLFDLEIPSPSRCRMSQDAFQSTVAELAREIAEDDRRDVPVLELSPVQVALDEGEPCRQTDTRGFDPEAVSRRVRDELAAALPAPAEVRILVLYVTNLALRAPPTVQVSLTRLSEVLSGEGVAGTYLAAVGPEVAVTGLGAEGRLPWISTLEPAFGDALFEVLGRAWPFQSVSHGPGTVVPLAGEAEAAGLEAFRLCATSRIVQPVGPLVGMAAHRPGPNGPAYTVALDPVRLVPSAAFQPPTVEVRWEGCYGLCERPAPGRGGEISWLEEDTCLP